MPNVLARRLFSKTILLAPVVAGVAGLAGCAPPLLPQRYNLSADVLFDFGSARLRPAASDALRDILGQIRATFPAPYIRVVGHTDSIGSDAANIALSLRRAQAVKAWLVNAGVPAGAVETDGFGRREPIAPNSFPDGRDNPAGRAQNRRVELIASPA